MARMIDDPGPGIAAGENPLSISRFLAALSSLLFVIACKGETAVEFHDLAFDQALERAALEDKLVFVDFFTTWCAPCREMDATTFQDPEVASWLAEHTVALKVDAEANETNEALAKRFGVRSYPNYVFISPTGELVDRLAGQRSPDQFIDEGEIILLGENAVDRAQRALAKGDPDDPMLRSRLGDAYVEMGRDEDALREYLWCFDEGEQHRESYHGVRLSFLLSSIESLGRRYPPARQALDERRRAAEKRIVDGSAEYDDIAEYSSINRVLGEQQATLDLYDRVKEHGSLDPLTLFSFANRAFSLLVDAKRYRRIVDEFDVDARVERAFDTYGITMEAFEDFDAIFEKAKDELDESMLKQMEDLATRPDFRNEIIRSHKDLLRRILASSYQVLIGAGLLDDAAALAQRATAELDDAETRNALAWAGYLTGKPIDANLAQAREAFDLTRGQNIAIVNTFARLLAALGRREEAVAVAQAGLEKATTSHDRQTMVACLDYCRKPTAG